jgi:tellurite resistance protein
LTNTRPGRVALGRYAIALGLAGLGGAWTAAQVTVGAASAIGLVLVSAAFIVWVWLTVRYLIDGTRNRGTYAADLDSPATGPLAAYIPVVGILITVHFHQPLAGGAPWINAVFALGLAVVSAQLLTRWVSGSFDRTAPHPGYFLPVVAGPFIASIGFSTVGEHGAAIAAFGVGVFFWVVIGSLVFDRLMSGGPLDAASQPSLGVLLAPPGTGGVAWFAANGGHVDSVTEAFGGVLVLMFLLQLMLIPRYRRGGFNLDFWAFSFPLASSASYAVRWASASRFSGWQIVTWTALGLATAGIGALIAASIALKISNARQPLSKDEPRADRL